MNAKIQERKRQALLKGAKSPKPNLTYPPGLPRPMQVTT